MLPIISLDQFSNFNDDIVRESALDLFVVSFMWFHSKFEKTRESDVK